MARAISLHPETHIGREDAAEVFAEGGRGERRYFARQLGAALMPTGYLR